jgi:hypothetical protein
MTATLRREGEIYFDPIPEFAPLCKFRQSEASEQQPVLFAQIHWGLTCHWRGILDLNIQPRRLVMDTMTRAVTGPGLVKDLRLAEPDRFVNHAHIYGLLLLQPRGEDNWPDDTPGLLLPRRRFGNMFVTRVQNGTPMATRLRYYDIERRNLGTDHMGYSRSGWVVDEISIDSPDFAQQGGRVGSYELPE